MINRVNAIFLAMLLFYVPIDSFAHPLSPSLLKMSQVDNEQIAVFWKQPVKQSKGVSLTPIFSEVCRPINEPIIEIEKQAIEYSWVINCQDGVVGNSVSINGLGLASTYALVVFISDEGSQHFALLENKDDVFVFPDTIDSMMGSVSYLTKGFHHLLSGYDHILFIIGLLLLLKSNVKALVIAFSCFTVGHTLSLFYSGGFGAPLSEIIIESLILLSLVWLALEVLSSEDPGLLSIRNKPYLLTTAFGLVHGFGFAGAVLSGFDFNLGVALNILSFNVGIELGQLAIVVIFIPFIYLFRRWPELGKKTNAMLGYSIGGFSLFWMIQLFA